MKKIDSDLRVPRYTSYPTALHFHEGITAEDYATWLRTHPVDAPLSLYVHIPFCRQLCRFCGCHTRVVNHYAPIARYLARLEEEIRLVATHLPKAPVEHLHFGGGSPTALSAEDFTRLMQHLRRYFSFAEKAEIAIEIDPRTLDDSKIRAYAEAGVTRASLGVQDFHPATQAAVGRIQPYDMVARQVEQLRTHGIHALNLDLIYGLPHQTETTIHHTAEQALSLTPDRLSLFGYAHVPWMKKHQNLIDESLLPGAALRSALMQTATDLLVQAGYLRIGLDHFAKPGDSLAIALRNGQLCRNFQGYTTDRANMLIGFGASAISSTPQGYIQNLPDAPAYARAIGKGSLPVARGLVLTAEDKLRRELIMQLMCHMQADLAAIARAHGFPEDYFADELTQLQTAYGKDYLRISGNKLIINENSRHILRVIASAFDASLQEKENRYSRAI